MDYCGSICLSWHLCGHEPCAKRRRVPAKRPLHVASASSYPPAALPYLYKASGSKWRCSTRSEHLLAAVSCLVVLPHSQGLHGLVGLLVLPTWGRSGRAGPCRGVGRDEKAASCSTGLRSLPGQRHWARGKPGNRVQHSHVLSRQVKMSSCSFNRTANGRPPSLGRIYAGHCLSLRLGILPLSVG